MHIVTLGCGTGQATVLRGLRAYPCAVTAIVGVTDNGGHSGQLRRLLQQPQVGDTRQCLSALLDTEAVWQRLLTHRFARGDLHGVNVGNVMLAALTSEYGSLHCAVDALTRALGIPQRVLPVGDTDTHIGAILADGRQVVGEWEIIQRQPQTPITQLFLQPQAAAHPTVLTAISQADLLVICPGSLLTGVVAVLLHSGMRDALIASQAPCVYVCNLTTQPGQTDGYTVRQHVTMLQTYLGRRLDTVLCNTGAIAAELLAIYAQRGARPVVHDGLEGDATFVLADLVAQPDAATLRSYTRPDAPAMPAGLHLIRHDAQKLATQLMALPGRRPATRA